MVTIYKITNPKGKIYIGQTKDLDKRKYLYKYKRCQKQQMLYNSLVKYGHDNHTIEVIDTVEDDLGDITEIKYIEQYKSFYKDSDIGMNLTKGGNAAKFTVEIREKISASLTGAKNIKAKKLYQYNLDGSFIREWECMKCIERELGYNTSMLSQAAKGSGKAYGYLWSYKPL